MRFQEADFVAVDFETANPQRVSACSVGFASVRGNEVTDSFSRLILPIGGHAEFQSRIHGIKEEHTRGKPNFGELFPQIAGIYNKKLLAYSAFDKQVLSALFDYFNIDLTFDYIDVCALAKTCLPELKNHKLKHVVKHFGLPKFKHHDAREDAIACAEVFLRLRGQNIPNKNRILPKAEEFKGFIIGILSDGVVNYKEAYSLLYWMEDNPGISSEYPDFFSYLREALADDVLDSKEKKTLRKELKQVLKRLGNQSALTGAFEVG